MLTYLNDTNPKVEEKLIKLIRQKTVPQRLSNLFSMTDLSVQLSKRAIARQNPELNKEEVDLLFVKFNFGEDLFIKVKKYLLNSSNEEK